MGESPLSPPVLRALILIIDVLDDLLELEHGAYSRAAMEAVRTRVMGLLDEAGITAKRAFEVSQANRELFH